MSIFYNRGAGDAFEEGEEFGERGDSDEFDAGDELSEGEVLAGEVDSVEAGAFSGFDDIDNATDGFGLAVQGEFADEQFLFNLGLAKLTGEEQDGDGDWEIKVGAILGELGGGKADGDFAVGKDEAGVGKGGADTLAGLGDGFVGHADEVKSGEAAVCVALDGDKAAFIAVGNGGKNFCNHDSNILHF